MQFPFLAFHFSNKRAKLLKKMIYANSYIKIILSKSNFISISQNNYPIKIKFY